MSSQFSDDDSGLAMDAMTRSMSDSTYPSSYPASSPSLSFSSPGSSSSSSSTSPHPYPYSLSNPSTPHSASLFPRPPSSSSTASMSPSASASSPAPLLFQSHRCPLCHFSTSFDPALAHTCTRCGLTTPPSSDFSLLSTPSMPSSSIIQEAATAYRFHLLSGMSPLLSDLSRIVVDYLVWYRDPQSFHVGDKVDVMDVRGRWSGAEVKAVEGEEVLVGYDGWSRKWDQWIGVRSERLAPFGTKTKPTHTPRVTEEADDAHCSDDGAAQPSSPQRDRGDCGRM